MTIHCERCERTIGNTSKVSQEEIEKFREEKEWPDTFSDEEIAKKIIQSSIQYGVWEQYGVHGDYCQKCLDEFTKAREDGALTIRKWTYEAVTAPAEGYWIETEEEVFVGHEKGENMSQVEAIVKVREIAKTRGIDTIIFTYMPHGSIWFLDNYLEAHPKIKKDVERAEKGIIEKIKSIGS